jgi:hypothetical protein
MDTQIDTFVVEILHPCNSFLYNRTSVVFNGARFKNSSPGKEESRLRVLAKTHDFLIVISILIADRLPRHLVVVAKLSPLPGHPAHCRSEIS